MQTTVTIAAKPPGESPVPAQSQTLWIRETTVVSPVYGTGKFTVADDGPVQVEQSVGHTGLVAGAESKAR